MKICYVTHNVGHDNGGGVLSSRLIEGVKENIACEVVAVTSVATGKVYEIPLLTPGMWYSWTILRKLRAIFRTSDVIHVFDGYPYGIITFLASFGLRKKIIITFVGSGSIIKLYSFPFLFILKYVYRTADVLTAISSFTAKEVQKMVSGLKVKIITPGVDFGLFGKTSPLPTELESISPYILSVGSLRWRKGYKYSISGFAKIAGEFPLLKYVIVGKKYTDKEYIKLQRLISELGLDGRVVILSTIDDPEVMRSLYAHAELFCLLSQNVGHDVEGFGIVFLEAAASGVPVIGSSDCGVEDAVQNGKNGYLVRADDVDGFADAVRSILRDSAKKNEMGNLGKEWAGKNGWDGKIKEYCEIYDYLA